MGRSWVSDCLKRLLNQEGQAVIAGLLRQLQSGLQIGDGLLIAAKINVSSTTIGVGLVKRWLQADRLVVVGDGLLVLAKSGVLIALTEIGDGSAPA